MSEFRTKNGQFVQKNNVWFTFIADIPFYDMSSKKCVR